MTAEMIEELRIKTLGLLQQNEQTTVKTQAMLERATDDKSRAILRTSLDLSLLLDIQFRDTLATIAEVKQSAA